MGRIEIAISEVLFQPPHALISLILVKVEPNQIVDISSFNVHYLSEKALTSHLQGHQLKEIVAAILELHAMLFGALGSFYQLPALL
jgi:hypothetical protein